MSFSLRLYLARPQISYLRLLKIKAYDGAGFHVCKNMGPTPPFFAYFLKGENSYV